MSNRNKQYGFFDREQQLEKIYKLNGFLPKLNSLIDGEMFRPIAMERKWFLLGSAIVFLVCS